MRGLDISGAFRILPTNQREAILSPNLNIKDNRISIPLLLSFSRYEEAASLLICVFLEEVGCFHEKIDSFM
jgi:hypothetical protein